MEGSTGLIGVIGGISRPATYLINEQICAVHIDHRFRMLLLTIMGTESGRVDRRKTNKPILAGTVHSVSRKFGWRLGTRSPRVARRIHGRDWRQIVSCGRR
jgi:hypothetical protein